MSRVGNKTLFILASLLFCYALIFSPSQDVISWSYAKYDDKRILELALVIVVLVAGCLNKHKVYIRPFFLFSFLGTLIVSSSFANEPLYAFCEFSLFVGLFFLSDYIKTIYMDYGSRVVAAIVVCLLLSALLYLVSFYAGYVGGMFDGTGLQWPEPFLGFSNVRFFNQYQVWGLSILMLPFLIGFQAVEKYKRVLFFILLAWWVLLFVSGSKGALLAIMGSIFFTLGLYRGASLKFVQAMLLTAAGGFLVYILMFVFAPNFYLLDMQLNTVAHSTSFARLELWEKAIDMLVENPFFGVGPMHYAWHPNDIAAHPHNSVLQIAAEWGLPATLMVFWVFCYGLYCWVKRFNYKTLGSNKEPQETQIPIVLFSSLVAGVLYSLVSGVIVMPLSQVMGATVIGLMLGVYQAHSSREEGETDEVADRGEKLKVLLSRGLAVLTLVVLIWSVMPQLLPRITGQEVFLEKSFQTFGPRFWQQGGIPH